MPRMQFWLFARKTACPRKRNSLSKNRRSLSAEVSVRLICVSLILLVWSPPPRKFRGPSFFFAFGMNSGSSDFATAGLARSTATKWCLRYEVSSSSSSSSSNSSSSSSANCNTVRPVRLFMYNTLCLHFVLAVLISRSVDIVECRRIIFADRLNTKEIKIETKVLGERIR